MTTNISIEKVKELIRLAERARAEPGGRADVPQRGGWAGSAGLEASAPPMAPQPAGDWQTALQRYVLELPDGAIEELFALYRSGGGVSQGDGSAMIGVGPATGDVSAHDHAAYLLSRPDLVERLRQAVQQL